MTSESKKTHTGDLRECTRIKSVGLYQGTTEQLSGKVFVSRRHVTGLSLSSRRACEAEGTLALSRSDPAERESDGREVVPNQHENKLGFRGCVRTRNRHPEGRKRARAVFSGRVALRDLVVGQCLIRFHHQRKVPHPYSGADDSAPSLTGFGMTPFGSVRQFSHTLFSPCGLLVLIPTNQGLKASSFLHPPDKAGSLPFQTRPALKKSTYHWSHLTPRLFVK